jgi:hypothetical protein
MQDPTYIDTDGCVYTYTPPGVICSLRRYNIAQCARQRMQIEHFNGYHADDDYKQYVERWKRERVSFWSTLAHSIPHNFRVNR